MAAPRSGSGSSSSGAAPALLALCLAGLALSSTRARTAPKRTELTFRFLSADACPDVSGLATRSLNTSLRMEGRTTVVIDVDLYVDRTAASFSKLTSNHTRCQDVVSASTCQQREFFTFNRGVCTLIATPLMPWSSFVNSLQPPLKCPMKKGFYRARGISVDMRAANALLRPGDDVGAYFVGRGTLHDQDGSPFLCLSVLADLVRVKIRG